MRSLLREAIETIVPALLIFATLQLSVQNYRVEGSSMEPTLEEGQRVLVNKLLYFHIDPQSVPFINLDREGDLFLFHPPRHGEVVVFDFPKCHPNRSCVKRIIGVPGDVIQIEEGRVYLNGSPLEEPFVKDLGKNSMKPLEVPDDAVFVLGDNRRPSNDSRNWGPLPLDSIVGRAWISYWPLSQWQVLESFSWLYR